MTHRTFSIKQYGLNTFSSLKIRNYRLYYIGQIISTSGTFMQLIAQAWLVLKLTDSGTALGVVTALQYLPILFLGPYGGLIADRFSKRTILYLTQSISGLLALILGLLVATGWVTLWSVYVRCDDSGLRAGAVFHCERPLLRCRRDHAVPYEFG
jgi:nitrate/nitrite transporter NarK